MNQFTVPLIAVDEIAAHLASVRHKLLILSGKGGVGKSTFTGQLAYGLAEDEDRQVLRIDRY